MNLLSRIRFVSRIRTVDSCRVFGRSIRIARSHANYLSHSYSAIHPLIDDLHGDLVYTLILSSPSNR